VEGLYYLLHTNDFVGDYDYTGHLLTGGIFGAMVLVPFLTNRSVRNPRASVLVAGGAVIHVAAFWLAVHEFMHLSPPLGKGPLEGAAAMITSTATTGIIAALLVAALLELVSPARVGLKLWAYAFVAGAIGGLVMGISWNWNMLVGYTTWQMLVCSALYFGRKARAP
jgi:hypothetical protein